jgi:hypothetical protein
MPSSVSSLTEGSLMKAIWSVAPALHLSGGATCLTLSLLSGSNESGFHWDGTSLWAVALWG